MQNNKVKNTIVLRGMASNVVDEAIVILKPNVKIKNMELTRNIREKSTPKSLILKEAEHVVTEYVNKINQEQSKQVKINMEKNIKKLRIISVLFFVAFVISLIV